MKNPIILALFGILWAGIVWFTSLEVYEPATPATVKLSEEYDQWAAHQICFTDMECEIAYRKAMDETCNHERECEENFDFDAYIADVWEAKQK